MVRILVFLVSLSVSSSVLAQIDYNRQYFNAKDLFRQKKYNLAMEAFKPVIQYDKENKFVEYASYYYALSAYNQGFKAVAKDMLNQIKSLYPKWSEIEEVNFFLGKIYFENHDYFQGIKIFNAIQDKKFEKDIAATKAVHIGSINDIETLRMLHEEFPKDETIGKTLAYALSKKMTDEENAKLLETLIEKFKLNRTDYFIEAPETFMKQAYSVSVLLPFMVNTLEPTAGKKRNQVVLDFYEGMKLAADTVSKSGIPIKVRAYDTERNVEKLKRILNTEELKGTDLIVGPFFPDENKFVQEFSLANKINVVNPFSNNTEIIGNNPHAFLFQPSSETIAMKAAEYIASRTQRKHAMVFYGPNKKDSVLAANFIKTANERGVKVVASPHIANKDTKKIKEILATPTEYDEFKYPSQFTLKKDSLGCIFVASDDPLIYTEVVGAVETRADSIRIIGSENWLDDSGIDPEKFQTLGVTLAAPNFTDSNKAAYQQFFRKFVKTYGRTPSSIARMGYEFMIFFGRQLQKNGVYFQEALSSAGVVPGVLYEGFNFHNSRNNQLVPFIMFKKGELKLVDKH
jgi:hypothetical protein